MHSFCYSLCFSFVRSGGVFLDNGYLWYAGQLSYYWSLGAYSDTPNAYGLGFASGSVSPSYNNVRHYGFSLRCLQE